MKRLIVGAVTAAITAITARKVAGKQKPAEPQEESLNAKIPKFQPGDTVITTNPFTKDYAYMDFDGSPLFFTVAKVKWCAPDSDFRYLLEEEDEWVAESWLEKPEYPQMTMEYTGPDEDEEKPLIMTFTPFSSDDEPEEAEEFTGHRALEKAELARRQAWTKRADELLDAYLAAEGKQRLEILAQYNHEKAMHDAGSLIREIGGELGGQEPEQNKEA